MHPAGYIFDLDGTLVDSLQDISGALNAALADHRLPTASSDQVREWVGEGLRTLCRRACQLEDERVVERVFQSALEHYQWTPVRFTTPYPNVLTMLELLANRGARLAVLSNKPHVLTIEVLRRLELDRFFVTVRGSDDTWERKPAPDGALRIAELLGIQTSDISIVGDSPIDIETARRAGMKSVAVTWGFRPEAELRAAMPDYLVHDSLEIVSL